MLQVLTRLVGTDSWELSPVDRLDALADWERVSAWVEARNLVPLCRRHHRLKTHTRWTYQRHHDGTVEWTDPHGKKWRDPPQRE